jgi:hypothetical protein
VAIVTGLLALGSGLWLLLIGVALHAFAVVGIATLVAGAGGGLSYMAGLNIINTIAPPDHRAETVSAFLVVCYLGFSIPALGVGIAANWLGLYAALSGAAIVLGIVAVAVMVYTTDRNLKVATSP